VTHFPYSRYLPLLQEVHVVVIPVQVAHPTQGSHFLLIVLATVVLGQEAYGTQLAPNKKCWVPPKSRPHA
jgi:hypothetical protein